MPKNRTRSDEALASLGPNKMPSVDEDIAEAKRQALYYLKSRARSSAEMRHYLARKGHGTPIQEEVVTWLEELGYIDDLQFSQQWIENRCRTKPMGERRLTYELRQKGIHQVIIDAAILEFREAVDETELACQLARDQVKTYQGQETSAARRKLAGFLHRRGFQANDIYYALEQVLDEEAEV